MLIDRNRKYRSPDYRRNGIDLVLLGGSTGGPQVLIEILSSFPDNFPAAFIVIQHMDEKFTPHLVTWMNSRIPMEVGIAREGFSPQPGKVLMASTVGHLVMTPGLTLGYSREPADVFHHPSVDVFFLSVARYWPAVGIAVLLTGMGKDGAAGLLALHNRNWYTIAQDQNSSIVYGMPKAAARIGAATAILPAGFIGGTIRDFLHDKSERDDERKK